MLTQITGLSVAYNFWSVTIIKARSFRSKYKFIFPFFNLYFFNFSFRKLSFVFVRTEISRSSLFKNLFSMLASLCCSSFETICKCVLSISWFRANVNGFFWNAIWNSFTIFLFSTNCYIIFPSPIFLVARSAPFSTSFFFLSDHLSHF